MDIETPGLISFLLAIMALCQIAELKLALKSQKISKRGPGTSFE